MTDEGIEQISNFLDRDELSEDGSLLRYDLPLIGRWGDYVSVKTRDGQWQVLDENGKNMLE